MTRKKESFIKVVCKQIVSFGCIAIGATMAALALELFLIPNLMIDGGLTGISIVLNTVFGGSLSFFIFFLNLPFLVIGYKQLGLKFLVKAIFGIVTFSLLLEVFHGVPVVTEDIILASIYGGLLLGIGVGTVIKFGGCLDGTEIIAILLSKRTNLSVGQVVLFINIFVYGIAVFVFGPDRALYSLLTYFITYKIIDIVSEGMDQAKAVYIVTENDEDISSEVFRKMGRNMTVLDGVSVDGTSKKVLYTVITRLEISELREIVKKADASSLVAISDVSEVIGHQIKKKSLVMDRK